MDVLAGFAIKNVSEYATSGDYPYWIVRVKDEAATEGYFWGAYETKERALECIEGMHGAVLVYYTVTGEI